MSRSSHHKEKYQIKSEVSLVHCNVGTSARTRPFSFEDIMLRRKNKIASEIHVAHGESDPREHNIGDAAYGLKTEADRHHQSAHGRSKPVSEDAVVVNSRRGHNAHGVDKRILAKDRSRDRRDLESKSNTALAKNPIHNDSAGAKSDGNVQNRKRSNRSNEDPKDESGPKHLKDLSQKEMSGENIKWKSMKEREHKRVADNVHRGFHSRGRDVDQLRNDYENEPSKRNLKPLTGLDKNAETGKGASEKESKTKSNHLGEVKGKTGEQDGVKRHHLHKSSKSLERNEKEPSTVHYEALRPKRKRSRSREHEKGRSRKPSASPRAHRPTLHGDQFYSSKDKFEKSHADTERKRVSSNGSNSNQRRYSGSSSWLGGYSPRKRKNEAAAKTPSLATRSPERRTAGWDNPVTRKELNITSSVVHEQSSILIALENGPKASTVIPVTSVGVNPVVISQYTPSSQMHAIDSIQLTQATRPMRRLYVENLPSSASEKDVVECINNFLLSSGVNHIKRTLPCISCMINKEKHQALIEFLTPEDASTALFMDGRSFLGSILKIRRPKDFVEVTTGVRDKSVDATNCIIDNVEDSNHKIFIGGISKVISSEMLLKIAGAFGSLKAFHFEHTNDIDENYAFLEYVDHLVTQKACAGLNGMKLGGQVLTVVQATPDALLLDNADRLPLYGIPEHAKPLLKTPTRVLKLKNLLDAVGISSLSEDELEEILEDIRIECARFGSVRAVNLVKHGIDSISREPFSPVVCNDAAMNHDCISEEVGRESDTSEELGKRERSEPANCIKEDASVETATGAIISDDTPSMSSKIDCGFPEPVGPDKNTFGMNMPSDEAVSNVRKDEAGESALDGLDAACQEILYNFPGGSSNKLSTSSAQLVNIDVVSDVDPKGVFEMLIEATDAERSKLEADVGRPSSPELDSCPASEPVETKEIPHMENPLEVGCVLVEFKREEAACMAAHSLHGRLFDDRIVCVEYVDPDLYQKRFPKLA